MNRTLRRSRARRKRNSLALSEGAATGQTPPQPFERRLLKKNERVPHIIRVGLGTHRQHRADGLHQPGRPSAGLSLPRCFFLHAHVVSMPPEVCHNHCNRARPFRAATHARRSPSPPQSGRGSSEVSLPDSNPNPSRCASLMVANNPDRSGRRDNAVKALVNGHVQQFQILSTIAESPKENRGSWRPTARRCHRKSVLQSNSGAFALLPRSNLPNRGCLQQEARLSTL